MADNQVIDPSSGSSTNLPEGAEPLQASQEIPSGQQRRDEDRRGGPDRRLGLDRRRGPGRRRSDDRRSAEEGEMSEEQFEFLMAIDQYKRVNRRPFPSWTEVLEIIKALGYRKVAQPQDLK